MDKYTLNLRCHNELLNYIRAQPDLSDYVKKYESQCPSVDVSRSIFLVYKNHRDNVNLTPIQLSSKYIELCENYIGISLNKHKHAFERYIIKMYEIYN